MKSVYLFILISMVMFGCGQDEPRYETILIDNGNAERTVLITDTYTGDLTFITHVTNSKGLAVGSYKYYMDGDSSSAVIINQMPKKIDNTK